MLCVKPVKCLAFLCPFFLPPEAKIGRKEEGELRASDPTCFSGLSMRHLSWSAVRFLNASPGTETSLSIQPPQLLSRGKKLTGGIKMFNLSPQSALTGNMLAGFLVTL